MVQAPRVLIVDDHPLFRDALETALECAYPAGAAAALIFCSKSSGIGFVCSFKFILHHALNATERCNGPRKANILFPVFTAPFRDMRGVIFDDFI